MKTARHSFSEQAMVAVVGTAVAIVAAMVSFTGLLFLCAELFAAEFSYNSLVYGPAVSVCAGAASFVLALYVAIRWQGRRREANRAVGSVQAA